MGCANLKKSRCHRCKTPYSPHIQSSSSAVYQPVQRSKAGKGTNQHFVALTSTTIGCLHFDSLDKKSCKEEHQETNTNSSNNKKNLINKDCSSNKENKVMSKDVIQDRNLSEVRKIILKTPTRTPPGEPENINTWELMEGLDEANLVTDRLPFKLWTSGATSPCKNTLFATDSTIETKNKVKFTNAAGQIKFPPFGHDKVVIYFTSLRGVRKTYEDCCYVRMILKGSGFRIDERDVSMHKEFREELIELLGDESNGKLPKDGKLQNVLKGCEVGKEGVCEMCSDVRFIPCGSCSGSCKIYCEEEDDGGIKIGGHGVFQRCPYYNENGIVRCPVCCH
ncbi:hypothetical protein MKX01_024316 [Papaver californicum]|nr:hypothetical protein MKX01_024316 [Papaver californicum]